MSKKNTQRNMNLAKSILCDIKNDDIINIMFNKIGSTSSVEFKSNFSKVYTNNFSLNVILIEEFCKKNIKTKIEKSLNKISNIIEENKVLNSIL